MSFVLAVAFAVASALALNERRKRQHIEYLREKLPVADTNEDVIGVLEASGAEIAPKLLKAAETANTDAEWNHDGETHTPPPAQWDWLLKDLAKETDDDNRLQVLAHWLIRGFNVTIAESVMLCDFFESPEKRSHARSIITESMLKRAGK